MLSRKLRNQWRLMPVLIVLLYSGSLLLKRNQQEVYFERTSAEPSLMLTTATSFRPYVTKSLKELGKMDDINKYVLLLNHPPYCGAEVLIFLLQKLQGKNSYRHVRLKNGTAEMINISQQEQFVDAVYDVMRNQAVPLTFDRQIYFINFTSFGKQSPTYINLIRNPAERLLSRSTYNKHQNRSDLIQCLINNESNCTQKSFNKEHLIIPYFCGQHSRCLLDPEWGLQKAISTVENFYPVIGVLEELNATLEVLEHQLPYFFKGATNLYEKNLLDKFKNKKEAFIPPKTRERIEQALSTEYKFYNWVRRRLFSQLQMMSNSNH